MECGSEVLIELNLNNGGIQSKLYVTKRTKERQHCQALLAVAWKRNCTMPKNTILCWPDIQCETDSSNCLVFCMFHLVNIYMSLC